MDLMILGSEAHATRLQLALPARTSCARVSTAAEALRNIACARPPRAFVVTVDALDEVCARGIDNLAGRGLLVPTAIYFPRADAFQFDRAWTVARLGVDRLFENHELSARLDRLVGGRNALATYLLGHVPAEAEVARRLLLLLAERADAAFMVPAGIAAALGCSRSSLYAALGEAGLPPMGSVQLLFKILPAQRILARGGSAADAACVAGYASPRCMREPLKRELGWTFKDLRAAGWREMADQWLRTSAPQVKSVWTDAAEDWTEAHGNRAGAG